MSWTSLTKASVYVVVNFLSQVIFDFLSFLGMVMYANEAETKEKEKLTDVKKNFNIYVLIFRYKILNTWSVGVNRVNMLKL